MHTRNYIWPWVCHLHFNATVPRVWWILTFLPLLALTDSLVVFFFSFRVQIHWKQWILLCSVYCPPKEKGSDVMSACPLFEQQHSSCWEGSFVHCMLLLPYGHIFHTFKELQHPNCYFIFSMILRYLQKISVRVSFERLLWNHCSWHLYSFSLNPCV